MLFFRPEERDRTLFPHDPFKGMIVPRPVGWISTVNATGQVNLAPYMHVDQRFVRNGRGTA